MPLTGRPAALFHRSSIPSSALERAARQSEFVAHAAGRLRLRKRLPRGALLISRAALAEAEPTEQGLHERREGGDDCLIERLEVRKQTGKIGKHALSSIEMGIPRPSSAVQAVLNIYCYETGP